ncbi:Switch-associated protein 70 [Geodia barretti]|uniref:Switch-associated protein 70 n=1 Tax=Geodia barretti TaxID=519541 RepID=A0AA35RMN6_GEOBA|nr:Switch-associated protein 70 [Geodia barretti]
MATVTMNEILHRIIVLCSYTWNDSYGVKEAARGAGFTYPEFLECITDYFEMFKLSTSLTAEVISDLEDEIVNGVLKKGYLEKKGHVRRNWRRRWFILKRTILSYYSTDKKVFKGELVLNAQTKVNSLDDKGSRRNMFLVTCGATEKPFTISADDQKMKHDWMLAIRKAIALAKVAEGEPHAQERRELEQALSGFFLLKYGTDQPLLRRQDSDIQHMKHHTTKRKFRNIEKITKELEATPTGHAHSEEDDDERDDYVPMKPGYTHEGDSSTSDEDGYCHMEKVKLNGTSVASSSSGPVTPLTVGSDRTLNFPLPISGKFGSQDDVFNPDGTGLKSPDRPAQQLPKADPAAKREKTESQSPPKTTPTDSAHPQQESYLTILPSPKATPPPEDFPSPTHPTNGPPVPPRRWCSK